MAYDRALIVYYRRGCHLCDEMAVHLSQYQAEFNYQIKWVDIDKDPELTRRYNVDIPVVKYQDEVIMYHFFDEEQLRLTFTHAPS